MLDDRIGLSFVYFKKKYLVFNVKDVYFVWKFYFGEYFGLLNLVFYVVLGWCDNFSGLFFIWIGVGIVDVLFEDSE